MLTLFHLKFSLSKMYSQLLLLITTFTLAFTSVPALQRVDEPQLIANKENDPRNFINFEVFDDIVEESKGTGKISVLTDYSDGRNYRLPNNTIPLHYNLTLRTSIHLGISQFYGQVDIRVQAMENTDNITLHYRELAIVEVYLSNAVGDLIEAPSWRLQEDVEFLIIEPAASLIEGETYQVRISFNGVLRDDDRGFYRTAYLDNYGRTVWLAATQFESTNARRAFPW